MKLDRYPPDREVDQSSELPLYCTYTFPDVRLTAQFVPSSEASMLLTLARLQRIHDLLECPCGEYKLPDIKIDESDERCFVLTCLTCGSVRTEETSDDVNIFVRDEKKHGKQRHFGHDHLAGCEYSQDSDGD